MAAASYPEDLLYHPDHGWVRIEGDEVTVGVTWYAQDQLGEIVAFEPPAVGGKLTQGDGYAEVESVKVVADVLAPLSGEIAVANDALREDPTAINEDPYGNGWLVKIRLADPSERESLIDAQAYVASLGG